MTVFEKRFCNSIFMIVLLTIGCTETQPKVDLLSTELSKLVFFENMQSSINRTITPVGGDINVWPKDEIIQLSCDIHGDIEIKFSESEEWQVFRELPCANGSAELRLNPTLLGASGFNKLAGISGVNNRLTIYLRNSIAFKSEKVVSDLGTIDLSFNGLVPNVTVNNLTSNYINSTNVRNFALSGTCSEIGHDVVISGNISRNVPCITGIWSTNVDFKATDDGSVTLFFDHANAVGTHATPQSLSLAKDTILPTQPGLVTTGSVPTNYQRQTPTFTFTNSSDVGGVSHYNVEIRKSDNSIVKSYVKAAGDGGGLTYFESADFLSERETYYVNIKAVDVAGNESVSRTSETTWVAMNCPPNFIAVPGRAPYTSLGFCVAQYEMKIQGISEGNDTGGAYDPSKVAVSSPTGTPWVNINRNQAITECRDLGRGYDLISNSQWQSIAQNAELNSVNWTSGVVGMEMMYRGHSDSVPNNSLSVAAVTDKYDQTGNGLGQSWGTGKEQRRTLYLSTGTEIWDFAGNVREWVIEDNSTNFGTDGFWYQITDITNPMTANIGNLNGQTAKVLFGPAGNYPNLLFPQYGGLGYGFINYNSGAIFRGGYWYSGVNSGVYSLRLDVVRTDSHNSVGFRCTFIP